MSNFDGFDSRHADDSRHDCPPATPRLRVVTAGFDHRLVWESSGTHDDGFPTMHEAAPLVWLAALVGGFDELAALDTARLDDEEFDWTVVRPSCHQTMVAALGRIDGFCDRHADIEFRTICRRLLARVAADAPSLIRPKHIDRDVAAVVLLAARGNDIDIEREVAIWFALKSPLWHRSLGLARAVGIGLRGWAPRPRGWYGDDDPLGDHRLLIGAKRAYLARLRDMLDAA